MAEINLPITKIIFERTLISYKFFLNFSFNKATQRKFQPKVRIDIGTPNEIYNVFGILSTIIKLMNETNQ